MNEVVDQPVDRYRDVNAALFVQRRELRAAWEAASADATISKRQKRRLRRQLDEVTAQIVDYNIGLVRSYTRRFGGAASTQDREEFESAGLLGLMRAIDSYEPESGAFGQWAFKPIQREVLRSVRDVDHPNLNLGDFEKRPAILRAYAQLRGADESYRPSDDEVAAAAGVTVAQVRRVLAPAQVSSMHRPAGDDESGELGDTIPSEDPATESVVIAKLALVALQEFGLKALDSRELYIIVRRFGLDGEPPEKLAVTGQSLGLSREAVRQIEAKALAKLQHPIVLRKLNRASRRDDLSAAGC